MPFTRRDFFRTSAAASALAGLGLPTDALAASGERWVKSVCRGEAALREGRARARDLRDEDREGRDRVIVAGVVIETVPGAAPRVAARLLHEPGLALQGGDGDRRLAAVFAGPSGEALEALAERIVHAFPEVIGVFPTYVADDHPEDAAPAAKPAGDPA